MVVCGDVWWFWFFPDGLWWFAVICGGLSFSHTPLSLTHLGNFVPGTYEKNTN